MFQGLLEIDRGGRKIGIKEMGELNEKAFKAACVAKVPPEEVDTAFYELYSVTVGMETEMLDVLRYAQRAIYTRGDPNPRICEVTKLPLTHIYTNTCKTSLTSTYHARSKWCYFSY